MTAYWILKTEPSAYGFDQLERERTAVWDGVKNPLALKHLGEMRPGDQLMIYHTGDEKASVGFAEVTSAAYADPKAKDPKLLVVDIRSGQRLPKPVTLAAIKADPALADLGLVRMGRLSVVPATESQWRKLAKMGGR